MERIPWEGKVFVTREMTASFFDVDIRTISRYIEQNNEELSAFDVDDYVDTYEGEYEIGFAKEHVFSQEELHLRRWQQRRTL